MIPGENEELCRCNKIKRSALTAGNSFKSWEVPQQTWVALIHLLVYFNLKRFSLKLKAKTKGKKLKRDENATVRKRHLQ